MEKVEEKGSRLFLELGAAVVGVMIAVLLIWRLFRFFRQVVTRFGWRSGAEPAPITQ